MFGIVSHHTPFLSMRTFLLLLPLWTSVSAQVTNPTLLAGFNTLQECVQGLFLPDYALEPDMGCDSWYCVCNHFSEAYYTLSTMAFSTCSSSQYITQALSVLNTFCGQIPSLPTPSPAPAGITDPHSWPYFSTYRLCVQNLFGSVYELISDTQCPNWQCVCEDQGASYTLSTLATSQCTDSQDVSTATAFYSAFCAQISLTPSVPTAPSTTNAATNTPATTTAGGPGSSESISHRSCISSDRSTRSHHSNPAACFNGRFSRSYRDRQLWNDRWAYQTGRDWNNYWINRRGDCSCDSYICVY